MASVLFYEKPGCINNTRQKQQLLNAGHEVVARNILTEYWSRKELRLYFGQQPVQHWFNHSAPAIKLGIINPQQVDEYQAITLMLEQPILIRRPLMKVADKRIAGFDQVLLEQWIGLNEIDITTDYQQCPKEHEQQSCHHE